MAKKASLHNTRIENEVMKMRPVGIVEIAPDDSVVLEPGGLHIMIMGITGKLEEGKMFPLTLTFERAGAVEIMVKVMKAGAMDGMEQN